MGNVSPGQLRRHENDTKRRGQQQFGLCLFGLFDFFLGLVVEVAAKIAVVIGSLLADTVDVGGVQNVEIVIGYVLARNNELMIFGILMHRQHALLDVLFLFGTLNHHGDGVVVGREIEPQHGKPINKQRDSLT